MSHPEQPGVGHSEQERLAATVAGQIEAAVAAAERAAEDFRRQVQAAANHQAERARHAAEADARRIRQEAATWAAAYLEDSKRIVDEFTAERIARIGDLTDELIQGAESLQRRLIDAQNLRRQIYDLISSLGAMAEAIALEAAVVSPELPRPPAGFPPGESVPSGAADRVRGVEPEA